MIDKSLTMGQEEYNNFIRCLNNLREICNDVDIRNGFIRQRSNDRSCVFELNMTPLLEDISMPISDIKKKLDLLKSFIGQNDVFFNIHIEDDESESYFTVSDEFSSIKFMFPAMQFIDNSYMSEEELNNTVSINEETLLLNATLSNLITDRIRIITDNFNANAIQVVFDEESATIQTQTQSKDQYAVFMKDIATTMSFENASSINIVTMIFKMEHDDNVSFKLYKDEGRETTANKIETSIGDVDVKVYSRSMIVPIEEE